MRDFFLTFALFCLTIILIPTLLVNYVVLHVFRKIWLTCVSVLHPDVEFLEKSTIRMLLDTHRNQGIISVLLSIKGMAQPETLKRHLQEVVKRRDKSGNLAFPRLRHCLVTRCGVYAWQKGKFNLDQNLTVAPPNYKGRAVTEYNIQDYVCEIVTKYLPQGIPPWQMIIIPSSEDQHYILLKLHHVLLSEGLNIGDLLPLIPPTRQLTGNYPSRSPLIEVLRTPTALPQLKDKITEELSNRWNEFVSNYDPLECPKLLKTNPGFFQFQAILLITLISTIKECRKGFRVIKSDIFSKFKYMLLTINNESTKRQVTLSNYLISILVTLNPLNLAQLFFKHVWSYLVTFPFLLPGLVYSEFAAIYFCIKQKQCYHPQTIVGKIYNYVPLFYNAVKEVFCCFIIIFDSPRTVIQEILMQKESFETITLCGRKSVAWSDPVRTDLIRTIAKKLQISELEVMLAAISSCISKYFLQTNHLIPDDLPVTVRNVNSNYVFATGNNVKPEDSVSGILCLNLPIFDPEKEVSVMENLVEVKSNFRDCLDKQGLSHLLSLCQTKFNILSKFFPSAILSVYLKYLSRKYAVSITEVTSRYPNVKQKTLWGQEVYDVIFWRPPQANTSVSLCLNEYADRFRLGVMCDAQLVPHHALLAKGFPENIAEICKASGLIDDAEK